MTITLFFKQINDLLAIPSTLAFLGVAIFLTFKTGFVQLRSLRRFKQLVTAGGAQEDRGPDQQNAISSLGALFTAMSTTIGMGNVVMPAIAIAIGGPGALFWLVAYSFVGCVTKFAEVTFALHARKTTAAGYIMGGPTQYLKLIAPWLAKWYGGATLVLFACWSAMQSNTLAEILFQEGIVKWHTGLAVSTLLFAILYGGAHRVSAWASKLVPLMFVLYVSFSLIILFQDPTALWNAFKLIGGNIIQPAAAVGGFAGASLFEAIRWGTYQSVYITEAGVGTSAIPHSLADVERPTDQGILAMYSMAADMFLSAISGLLVLVTGVWMHKGEPSSALIYKAFKLSSPYYGDIILIASVTLFVLTTIIGNSFNGGESFAYFTKHRWVRLYYFFATVLVFLGSLSSVPLILHATSVVLVGIAIPNLLGIALLAIRYPEVLDIRSKKR